MKSAKIVMFGKPGAGKGTIGKALAKTIDGPHISTGDLLREQIAGETELGQRVQTILNKGHLVDDDTMNEIVRVTLKDVPIYILDGYPRTQPQAEHMIHAIGHPNYVINLQVPDEVVIERMLNRRRKGETEEVLRERLGIYEKQTAPVLKYFATYSNFRTFNIDGNSTILVTTNKVLRVLGLADDD
jgi:adenylate kinase